MTQKHLLRLFISLIIGILLWFLPHSENLTDKAWHLFTIFFTTIIAVILKPLPMGAISILAMAIATITHTLSLEDILAGFHNPTSWLVVFAFFISRGFIKTGLGSRIAYHFVSLFGKKTISLSYGLLFSELVLAPGIPSVTARTGGIIFPIVQGLAKSFGSDPLLKTERLIGSFLMKVAYQGSTITSAMFLTAMAANPFLASLTQDAGYSITWGKWALAALLPGIISLFFLPLLVYKLYPPAIQETPHAPEMARHHLNQMGRVSKGEWIMTGVMILLILLWIFGGIFNINATVAALLGLALLLVTGVLNWQDVVHEHHAWDTFIWFSTLIMLASFLNQFGFTPWLSEQVVSFVGNLNWVLAFLILVLVYFYSHYLFAGNTAHVGAMYPAFLMVAIGLGAPAQLVILVFAFTSSLMGGLTHYGSGPAPIFYGSDYIDIKDWWRLGFIISIMNLIIWLILGGAYWKLLGFW